jgi:hypothetical protein
MRVGPPAGLTTDRLPPATSTRSASPRRPRDPADPKLMGGPDRVRERYWRRYLPAQLLYQADAAPEASADVVIDNTDPVRPRVAKWPAHPVITGARNGDRQGQAQRRR